MKCRYCKSEIEDDSLYCRFCGERLFRTSHKEISVPKPKRLSDGRYVGQIMVNGVRQQVYGNSEKDYRNNARALKTGLIKARTETKTPTLREILDAYVDANSSVLSPSTIRGYRTICRNRFETCIDKPISAINFQAMVNDEAKNVSAKTVKNSWGLVATALAAAELPIPHINLPSIPKVTENFLDNEQIKLFLKEIKGSPCELEALLALHSLRMSELLALNVDDVYDNAIHVNKAMVPDDNNKLILKDTTKTQLSSRTVPIMIPRLLELLPETGRLACHCTSTINREIQRACIRADLPVCTCHDLRRSFASLGYYLNWSERSVMAIGGWSNMNTVHKVYIQLSGSAVNTDIEAMRNYYKSTTED